MHASSMAAAQPAKANLLMLLNFNARQRKSIAASSQYIRGQMLIQ